MALPYDPANHRLFGVPNASTISETAGWSMCWASWGSSWAARPFGRGQRDNRRLMMAAWCIPNAFRLLSIHTRRPDKATVASGKAAASATCSQSSEVGVRIATNYRDPTR
jgi:hypothetical protein